MGMRRIVSVVAVVSLFASVAHADVRTEARRHFRAGMALIAEGQVDAGVAELQEAFEILPHPNVLYNIGRAYAESGRYVEAVDYFERYLESDPPDRSDVMGYLTALRARLAQIEQREGPTEVPGGGTPEVAPVEGAGPAVASEEEIVALEDSATQIEALAESAQSDALRQRADRLRALAASLRERRLGGQTPVEGPGEPREQPDGPADPDPASNPLVLGQEREGDTYEETVVSSSRAAQSPLDAPNSTTLLTAQDLRLSGYNNPGEALRRAAGVSVMTASPGDVQFSIRGLNQRIANRSIVLIDGRSVYLDFLGGTIWTMLPLALEDIERLEVIRGPASALYGADAMTGIVNIITRPMGEYRSWSSAGVGSHGQLRVASTVTERLDLLRFRIGGGYEMADHYERAVGDERVDVRPYADNPNRAYDRLWFTSEASLRIADGYSITAGTALTTGNRAFQGISRLREVTIEDGLFSQTFLSATTQFGLSGRVFWNHFETDYGLTGVRDGGIGPAQSARVDRQDVIDTELVYQNGFDIVPGLNNQIIGGVGYRFKEIDWDWIPTVQTQHHFNVFLQDTLRIEEWVQIVLSARLDQHPLLSEPQISPRASVVVHPTSRQSIRVTAGTAFRSPTLVESYVQVPNSTPLRGVTAFGIGNTSLNPERIVSVELGYMLQESEYFDVEVNGYYNLVYDQILLSRSTANRLRDFTDDPSLAFDPDLAAFPLGDLQFANEEADFQQIGGEIGARVYPLDGLDIYANYAIHETSPIGAQAALAGRELDSRTSAHMVNIGASYRADFGLDISADFSWVSDQVWVEQVLDTERGGVRFEAFRLPSYATLNARIGWRFFDDQLEVALIGTNLIMEHREHPFGQQMDRRFMGSVTARY
jgi:outer membrane receptor protein involved in Fe transport